MSKEQSCGVDFLGLLTIAFIVLKLCGIITWSWWWVLSPIWLPIITVLALGFIFVFFSSF